MNSERRERLAQALEMFLDKIENTIEEKIPDWKSNNPYWEIDGDNGLPAYCPPTTSQDARESMSEDFIASGENTEVVDCYYFFEYCIHEIYGGTMSEGNPYLKMYQKPEDKPAQMTAQEQAVVGLSKMSANLIDAMFKGGL